MTAAAAIARILQEEETEYLFCFPVSPLIDACAAIGIRPLVGGTERRLVTMADGYSRATNGRRLGVATVQHGPGAENAYAGVAQAFADGSPLLFLPGGSARGRDDLPPNFRAGEAYGSVAKWSTTLAVPERVPERLRRAFTLLRTGRRAPVVLELPADVAAAEIETPVYRPAPAARSAGDPAGVREAVRLLLAAERPLLHAGQGVLWAEAWEELRALAEAVPAPVMTTLMGKSAFPEDHPLALGTGGHSGTGPAGDFLRRADLIVGVGCSFTATVFAAPIPPGKRIVHITNHEGDLSKDVAADCVVLGDAKLVLQQMLAELSQGVGRWGLGVGGADPGPNPQPSTPNPHAAGVRAAREAWRAQWLPKLTSAETPINPYRVIHELMQVADRERMIVTHDSGTPRD